MPTQRRPGRKTWEGELGRFLKTFLGTVIFEPSDSTTYKKNNNLETRPSTPLKIKQKSLRPQKKKKLREKSLIILKRDNDRRFVCVYII